MRIKIAMLSLDNASFHLPSVKTVLRLLGVMVSVMEVARRVEMNYSKGI